VDPIAVHDIQQIVSDLRRRGIGVLISDHNVEQTLDIVDRAYIMYDGRVRVSGTVAELVWNEEVAEIYLGPTLTARMRERYPNPADEAPAAHDPRFLTGFDAGGDGGMGEGEAFGEFGGTDDGGIPPGRDGGLEEEGWTSRGHGPAAGGDGERDGAVHQPDASQDHTQDPREDEAA
jgi:hypothetical protein